MCIFENKIAWSDNRNGKNNFDIFMLDLTNNKETQITNFQDTSETECSIYEDKIVYIRPKIIGKDRYGDDEIYNNIYLHEELYQKY